MTKLYLLLLAVQLTPHVVYSVPINGLDPRPTVTVQEGVILGLQETQNGVDMFTYRGIPYAKPPTHELRFMPPEPVDSWTFELDASYLPPICPQLVSGKEDCLYLNVYTPANVDETSNLSVMVFIHGGGFVLGSSAPYDQTYPLVKNDVIVVNIQYRIGILGFFSTDDEVIPGNMGLQDQTLALQWIKNNIASFGGNPDSITIFGNSAGSVSAHFQVLTPYATGLFNRYILMSGDGFMPWSTGRDFYTVSRDIARRNDCPENPSADLVACLQGVKNYILLNDMQAYYIDWNFQPFRFGPRVDGDYIPDDPAKLVMNGQYNQVASLMGVVANEMALETGEMYAIPAVIDSLFSDFAKNGQASLMLYDDEDSVTTTNSTYEYYLGAIQITDENADETTKMYTDRILHVGFDWLVQQQADVAKTYTYQFDYRGTWGLMDYYKNIGLNLTAADTWIAHADDLQYIFEQGAPLTNLDDLSMSCLYSTYFTNFAKYENPTPAGTTFCINDSDFSEWEQTDASNMRHLSISLTPAMTDDSRQDVRTFWESQPLRINAILRG